MRLGMYVERKVPRGEMLRFAREMVETWGADQVIVPVETSFGRTVKGEIGCEVVEEVFDVNVGRLMDMMVLMVGDDMISSDWCVEMRGIMAKEGKAVLVERIE